MILNSIVTSDKPEHTAAVVEAKAVPHLVELLKCTNETANLQVLLTTEPLVGRLEDA